MKIKKRKKKPKELEHILFFFFGLGTGVLSLSIANYVSLNWINIMDYTPNELSLYGSIIGTIILIIYLIAKRKLKEAIGRKK